MAVSIGQDALGNAIVTGHNNQTFVFFGIEKLPEGLLADIQSGRRRLADIPEAVPLPALTLTVAFADDTRTQWKIAARRANGDPVARSVVVPWRDDPAFDEARDTFWRLSRLPVEKPEEAARLNAAAHRIGEGLAVALSAEEAAFLAASALGDPPPPLLVIESDDDRILALPWELIRLDGNFAVRDGRLDLARSVPTENAPVLSKPSAPVGLLVNISAPEGGGLDYERESYAIVRALHEHLGIVINEMGEVDDLVEGLRRGNPAPIGVHFSGHGGPGALVFEDEYGDAKSVEIGGLFTEIRRRAPDRLPRFFYLACCHGGDPVVLNGDRHGLPATATALHREGISQVAAYFGPVLDDLSTRAERGFYTELANGRRTRDAVRIARSEMSRARTTAGRQLGRDAGGEWAHSPMAFAWAQMVLYQRGPDYPLGTRIEGADSVAIETTERRTERPYPNSRTRVLKAGFVGRRKEMHALRRDLRGGRHLHVVQGTGGFGKSAFCAEALKVYDRLGWQPFAVWCLDVEKAPNPVAGLVSQLEAAGIALCGDKWSGLLAEYEQAASQDEGLRTSSGHLLFLLEGLLAAQPRKLVLYLDNLESLQTGPAETDGGDFAEWRDRDCASLWNGLLRVQRESPGRLAVLASTRYRHQDFGAVVPFDSLPANALWRMLLWFPSLRKLSEDSRGRLLQRLAGHPRAVELLDGLIEEAIRRWEPEHGPFVPGCLDADDEQAQLISRVLPELDAQLSENLLFGALWDRVLDDPSRELLIRAGVLRRPGDRTLLVALAGEGKDETLSRLVRTGLLTEIREPRPEGGWILTYRVHPTVSRLAEERSEHRDDLHREGHQRAGDHLEKAARSSPSWEDNIEAAYQLREFGEVDRAFDLIAPLIQWLQGRGRIQDSRVILAEIGNTSSLEPNRAARIQTFEGSAAQAYGDLPRALTAYRAGLAIFERLAATEPSNATWRRDLSVSQERIGDVLAAQGRLDDALSAYRAGLAIRERLAAADPRNATWQRDLSVSQIKVGEVLSAQGRLDDALSAYRAGLAIAERLAAADPSNATWQRDLSVTQNKVGDVLSAQGRLDDALTAYRAGLAIRERLAEADPSNAGWQHDLAVSQDNIGDALSAQGRLDDALTAYRAGLVIFVRLAEADPSNAGWQHDLSVSRNKIGDVLSTQGRLDDALIAYRAALAITEGLVVAGPSNARWRRDLFASLAKVGSIEEQQQNTAAAASHYREAEQIIRRLTALDPSNARWRQDLAVIEQRLAAVSAVSRSGSRQGSALWSRLWSRSKH
jgi:tetratricopeptide (TPR) repeat protein